MRVLLIDRDNSNREIRNRLRHFGVEGADNFKILTRTMGRPGLLDHHAWQSFPVKDYDLVIIDSRSPPALRTEYRPLQPVRCGAVILLALFTCYQTEDSGPCRATSSGGEHCCSACLFLADAPRAEARLSIITRS